MKNKSTKALLTVTSVGMLVLLGVFVYGAYDIRSKNEEVSRLLLEADKLSGEAVLLQSVRNMQNMAEKEIVEFDGLILYEHEIVSLIEMIERVGRRGGLTTVISSVSLLEETVSKAKSALAVPEDAPKRVELVIESKGPKASIVGFARALEAMPHRLMMMEESISASEGEWQFKAKAEIYTFSI